MTTTSKAIFSFTPSIGVLKIKERILADAQDVRILMQSATSKNIAPIRRRDIGIVVPALPIAKLWRPL
ncbi:hypothetical protein ACFL2V_12205 [Pseudomonadota bacterium]